MTESLDFEIWADASAADSSAGEGHGPVALWLSRHGLEALGLSRHGLVALWLSRHGRLDPGSPHPFPGPP